MRRLNNVYRLLMCLCVISSLTTFALADVTIAKNGKSTFTIVIPDRVSETVVAAAKELQRDIKEATGAVIEVVTDGQQIKKPFISLGATQQAISARIDIDGIADGGFRIVTQKGNIYIRGLDTSAKQGTTRNGFYDSLTPQSDLPDPQWTEDGGFSNGTANGVYTFLEDFLDVRWLMPGELGRDVLQKSTFIVPQIDQTYSPQLLLRKVRLLGKSKEHTSDISDWAMRQKMGTSINLRYDHDRGNTVSSDLFDKHPEWFAMRDGKRERPTSSTFKLETTNQELVKYYAEKAIERLKDAPRPQTYSLSLNDHQGWSDSPESKALYDMPTAERSYISVTPLVLKWYHDVSSIVQKEYPQGKLAGWLYSHYIDPPLKGGQKLPDNFIPVIAPAKNYGFDLYKKSIQNDFDTVMDSWSKVAPNRLFYYDWPNLYGGTGTSGVVIPPGIKILQFIAPRITKYHIKGIEFGGDPAWSQAALRNYLTAKLLWNPKADIEELQHDWLTRAYGEQAGAIMEQFYRKLEHWYDTFYKGYPKKLFNEAIQEINFKEIYGPHYEEMEKLLLQAKSQPMTKMQKERLNLIELNMIILQYRLRNAGYLPASFSSPLQRSGEQVIDLMMKGYRSKRDKYDAFDLFPVAWFPSERQPKRTAVDIKLNQDIPKTNESQKVVNKGYIQLYSKETQKLNVSLKHVDSGSAFVWYSLWEQKKNTFTHQARGFYAPNTPISWNLKAGAYYLLRIQDIGIGFTGASRPLIVDYDLSISEASLATTKLVDGTLYWDSNEDTTLYVSVDSVDRLYGEEKKGNVIVRTMTPVAAARADFLRQHTGSKVLLELDKGWKFSTDPDREGVQNKLMASGYDDSLWKTVTATDTWQAQGYPDYHGTTWYRKNFKIDKYTKKVLLLFGAVDGDAIVYFNGKKVGEHLLKDGLGWDESFAVDVTDAVKKGDNTIAVQVTKNAYVGGIYKGVALIEDQK